MNDNDDDYNDYDYEEGEEEIISGQYHQMDSKKVKE